jgi:hypothetical protein
LEFDDEDSSDFIIAEIVVLEPAEGRMGGGRGEADPERRERKRTNLVVAS